MSVTEVTVSEVGPFVVGLLVVSPVSVPGVVAVLPVAVPVAVPVPPVSAEPGPLPVVGPSPVAEVAEVSPVPEASSFVVLGLSPQPTATNARIKFKCFVFIRGSFSSLPDSP
ncbi:MAG: hypothetical protein JNL82_08380 [Myxococcales bacterium]|nr:hypothetical protein [Myxococcales bacterium]